MERVETLVQKLQEQLKQGAPPAKLLLTVQMLQHQLLHLQSAEPAARAAVTVSMPVNANLPSAGAAETPDAVIPVEPVQEEKIIEVLQVDEAEVEAELEEIKRNAALMQQISGHSKPQLLFEIQEDDIPTLPKQPVPEKKEVNDIAASEAASLNDTLKTPTTEVSHKLTELPVKDLKKAIGVNERFLYLNELFRGDEAMYERSIKTINSFSIFPEAEYWIRRELKTKLGWKDSNPAVMQFDQLVKRRFS
ncbi:MAG: hypothetical protein IPP72_02070 [Chitinophagaceae bacterium]|nr:hypothetical protein [Chitinophagaceae bacterium]